MNAQCVSYSAPSAIHCRSVATLGGVMLGSFDFAGGMCSSGSVERMRRITSLSSGLPGTITPSPPFTADSRTSSRRSGLALLRVRPVAEEAFVREDRPDVAVEADRAGGGWRCARREQQRHTDPDGQNGVRFASRVNGTERASARRQWSMWRGDHENKAS